MLNPDFLNRIYNKIPNPRAKFLLAISGGMDSCTLFDVFVRLNLSFEVAHVNYRLRGMASDLDQFFVEDLCLKHDIPFHLKIVNDEEKKQKKNTQVWARDLRYHFFAEIKKKRNLMVLVTAHHLNDDLETFVLHLSKASGLSGLKGISSDENKVLRPFLSFPKADLQRYAENNCIKFREDESNIKNDYTRNFIRNEIVPKLTELNSEFISNFKNSLNHLKESEDFINSQIQEVLKQISIAHPQFLVLDKGKLFSNTPFVVYEILKQKGFLRKSEHQKINSAETGSFFHSKEWVLHINRNELIFKPNNLKTKEIYKEIYKEISLPFESHSPFYLKIWETKTENNDANWRFDFNRIQLPLILRTKKEGDVFYPTGMLGSKKISKYFKDEKYSTIDKENALLICDANQNTLGVLGKRQDRRFIPNQETQRFVYVQFNKNPENL